MKLYALLAALYVGVVILANWLASSYIVHVPLTPYLAPAGVFAIGGILVLRDWMQQYAATLPWPRGRLERLGVDESGWFSWNPTTRGLLWTMPLVYAAGLISWGVGDAAGWTTLQKIAVASIVAFTVSETVEAVVFTPLRKRSLALGVGLSGTVGLALDSYIFLTIAFGSLAFFWGQFWGKFEMVALGVALTLVRRKVVPVAA